MISVFFTQKSETKCNFSHVFRRITSVLTVFTQKLCEFTEYAKLCQNITTIFRSFPTYPTGRKMLGALMGGNWTSLKGTLIYEQNLVFCVDMCYSAMRIDLSSKKKGNKRLSSCSYQVVHF